MLYHSVPPMAPRLAITSGPFPEKPCTGAERGYVWLQGNILMAHTLILPIFLTHICCVYAQDHIQTALICFALW